MSFFVPTVSIVQYSRRRYHLDWGLELSDLKSTSYMGRTKNPNPQRRVQFQEESKDEEPAVALDTHEQYDAPAPYGPETILVAIGPGLTVPITVPAPRSRTKKRKRIVLQEEEEVNIELGAEEADELTIYTADNETTIYIQTRTKKDDVETWKLLLMRPMVCAKLSFAGGEDEKGGQPYQLVSSLGVANLLHHVYGDDSDMSAVGLALEDGTVKVQVEVGADSTPTLSVFLTMRAVEVMIPNQLPMGTAKRAKRFRPVKNLQHALAALYPDTTVANAVQKKLDAPSITAKMVYGMVDNVQLTKYEQGGGYDKKEMKIAGLVPKLRPYQEAALQWMLQREEGNFESDEWELAWVVIQQDSVVPLTKRHTNGIFYCPFAGWLVSSYLEAQEATRGTAPPLRGGILADSMGLGKTVEVIACMLANKCKEKTGTQVAGLVEERGTVVVPAIVSAPSTPVKAARPINREFMKFNEYGACICGKDGHFKGCLTFVLCESCREPMHGLCAGFQNLDQVLAKTFVECTENMAPKDLVRLCPKERCPTCVFASRSKGLLESRATLIVTPPAILNQWEREIRRHSSIERKEQYSLSACVSPVGMKSRPAKQPLKVVVYPGIRNLFHKNQVKSNEALGRPECHLVHPDILADADVVLMTFDSLMGDLSHSDENPYIDNEEGCMSLRARKRYRVVPSPLTSIKWWRVCLDEAQRVETPTATSARMALKLNTHHRWCISGTPIGRGKLEDLYGLVVFLRLQPFASKSWFQNCLRAGHTEIMRMVQQLLQHVLWRSTKSSQSVRTQMGIPAQVENKVALRFSSIERHFYNRQLEQTMLAASDIVHKNKGSKRRSSTKVELLTQHIHRLRAACCHPQVGSTGLVRVNKKRKANSQGATGQASVSIDSGVLTMDQILDRLIDDAKMQCEESQRLAVMHTNAMAALSRLKVESKQQGMNFQESDEMLLTKSCNLYKESLELADRNASPSPVIGESLMTGCQGFLTPRTFVRDGKSIIRWAIRSEMDTKLELRELWVSYDFEGPSKKICELAVRSLDQIPDEVDEIGSRILYPKDCAFQVSHSALGGEFVDVITFTLEKGQTKALGGFRTNRSKAWRLVVKNFHDVEECPSGEVITFVAGVSVDMFEPDIASDSLQRLHVLHNAALSMSSLQQLRSCSQSDTAGPLSEMANRINEMNQECEKIESLYLDGARTVHSQSRRELEVAEQQRKDCETELAAACARGSKRKTCDFWDDRWWDDVLSMCYLNGTPNDREQLCLRIHNDLECFSQSQIGIEYKVKHPRKKLPTFADVDGLQTGLSFRLADFLSEIGNRAFSRCMRKFSQLSSYPSVAEQLQNSHCMKCHADWNQQGPECNHCKLETSFLKVENDAMILCILHSIWKWLKDTKPGGRMGTARAASRVDERAKKFFDTIKACEKAWQAAKKAWRIHLDLLNDIDEVNQCKSAMRLAGSDEDLTRLSDDELNAIVIGVDIPTRLMDHTAKQAMALGNLRRHSQTLRYLKNQNKERQAELEERQNHSESDSKSEETNCIICLSPMEGERAVLACGHSFHHTPCIQHLIGGRNSGQSMISCPLRCTIKTKRQEIMIASDRRKDDGTQRTRDIIGSWGTKVTRLVCDLIDVSDRGEKSIVFSQWEDMLWVVEQALISNKVCYVRVKSLKKIGDAIKRFRSSDCTVLLLNVKNGAEGLTLVEATHIFMVEPLLNCGLDSQAISRIHRIGQTRTTYIHRFLVEDTIETKIDKLRMERQEDQMEDSINEARKKHEIEAGGIDGGFSQEELQDLLK
jgi:SNF2 family DNA or RNA helicase